MEEEKSKQRGVWNDEESRLLGRLVQQKGQKSWNEIAELLNDQCGTGKTGKQCRERYRNYVDPALEKSEWKPNEKLLFIILYQVYGNQWMVISKLLSSRSDVTIKNYFYRIVRKATKHIKLNEVPLSCIRTAQKFYMIYSLFTCLKEKYLSPLKPSSKLAKRSSKEKIVLNILKERGVTEQGLTKFQEKMIEEFKKYSTIKLPLEVSLSLKDFELSKSKASEVIMKHNVYNTAPLNELVVIFLSQEDNEPVPVNNSIAGIDYIPSIPNIQQCNPPPIYPVSVPQAFPSLSEFYLQPNMLLNHQLNAVHVLHTYYSKPGNLIGGPFITNMQGRMQNSNVLEERRKFIWK